MAKKVQLGYKDIEKRLQAIKPKTNDPDEIGYQLLYAFGKSEKDIARYKEGKGVLKTFDGLLIKGLFCYRGTTTPRLTDELEDLKKDTQVQKAAPKIVAVSDGTTLLAYDLREKDTYENPLDRMYCDFAFFYPLMDVERVHYVEESPADVKAAEKLAKLHDELRAYNEFRSDSDLHDLNIFITRLLFCFFAEDTGIFEKGLFTTSIARFTKPDGSDLSQYLDECFNVMDISVRQNNVASIVKQFPYVNGGLFSKRIQIPRMGQKARKIIVECGDLDWKDINPDIFGSMIQAVVNPEERANQGMHYTSVPNIMKVINPLFLDELRGEYNKLNEFYEQKLQLKNIGALNDIQFYNELKPVIRKGDALLKRMSKMKFFDPACGSGNFLIITYKSLRFLEMDILGLKRRCTPQGELLFVDNSVISLGQFYGIELLDFPHEVAMLSLWLAEHQMNTKLNENFGVNTKALPLKNITNIVCGNACRIDWNTVCPHDKDKKDEEIFIFGNPPYLGSTLQEETHKADMQFAISSKCKGWKKLDYIATWFILATVFCSDKKASFAFVSTNSICQGEQVPILWPLLFTSGMSISFAYTSFKWNNNAKNNAGVTVIVLGMEKNPQIKYIYRNEQRVEVKNICPYLIDFRDVIVFPQSKSISGLQPMLFGSKSSDGGALILTPQEKEGLIEQYPESLQYIKRYVGADDSINGFQRFCLWIEDDDFAEADRIPPLHKRFEQCRKMREESTKGSTQEMAIFPYKFTEIRYEDTECLVVPRVSSEKRKYIPMSYMPNGTVVDGSSQTIYNVTPYTFGIINSMMHMVWVKTVGGRLKTDYRYSAQLCYNTFPFPQVSAEKIAEIAAAAEDVLVTREFYPEKTLADLYDPDKMPQDLLEAHAKLDDIVESCYPGYPFANDEARLECLFKLYEEMTAKTTR